jgi:hypothetical protein
MAELKAIKATMLEGDVGFVAFEGRVYVQSCNCWHDRAKKIIGFLDSHHDSAADYLNGEVNAARVWAEGRSLVLNETAKSAEAEKAGESR